MASPYSRVAFTICIAIAIGHVLSATSDEPITSNLMESNVKNLTKLTMYQISKVAPDFSIGGEIGRLINPSSKLGESALSSCRELLDLAVENLNKSLSTGAQTAEGRASMISLQCAAGTTLQTCRDAFDDQPLEVKKLVVEKLETPISLNNESSRFMARLLGSSTDSLGQDEYPDWLSESDRELILGDSKIGANVVVAKDGSGNYKTISDAIKAAPSGSKNRFVIYVKTGTYRENVRIGIEKSNVMMFGDGMDKTIVYSDLSYGGGYSTWDSATFSVQGEGFMARDMRFTNTAGAVNQQAVALLSAADKSVFYRCQVEGYQDSLFAHSNRQFYRECQIYGTIDFIFGGAAVVVQKGGIHMRKPLRGQQNAITAHFRRNPACPTGIVVQRAAIVPSGDLSGVRSYLGRPWTEYATVVFMENNMDGFIDPKGWLRWKPELAPPDTIFLAEYANKGDGARTQDRVKWKGVRVALSSGEATKFTVATFIQGNQWLPATQVPYDSGL